jgi:hypothetical protein
LIARILFILIIIGVSNDLFAALLVPRPLRQLVIESDYIIVGYVVKISEKKRLEDEWTTRIAKIAVLENLEGEPKKDTIEIEFNPDMSCPYPDRYYDSTFVIAFLDWDKKRGKFFTHALSYGAKTLSKKEIEIYKQKIFEIQQILKIPDKEKQRIETIEWLVTCAENPVTRLEGIEELSKNQKIDSSSPKDISQIFNINTNQKERLKNVLLNLNGYVDFKLVDLVYKGNESEIDGLLLQKLKSLDNPDCTNYVSYLYSLKHKNSSKEMDEIMEKFNQLIIDCNNPKAFKQTIEKFIQLIE